VTRCDPEMLLFVAALAPVAAPAAPPPWSHPSGAAPPGAPSLLEQVAAGRSEGCGLSSLPSVFLQGPFVMGGQSYQGESLIDEAPWINSSMVVTESGVQLAWKSSDPNHNICYTTDPAKLWPDNFVNFTCNTTQVILGDPSYGMTVSGEPRLSSILGKQTEYWISLPHGYEPGKAYPLRMDFHNWGGDGNMMGPWGGAKDTALKGAPRGYITVAPTGYRDGGYSLEFNETDGTYERNSWTADGRPSWKVAGGTDSPGPLGPTCQGEGSTTSVYNASSGTYYDGDCYESCGSCMDQCWWNTCEDSIQQTLWILEEVFGSLCVDTSKVSASGWSNGAFFAWELATNPRTGGIFSAIAPVEGAQTYGFHNPPVRTQNLVVVASWGSIDSVVPPRSLGLYNARGKPGVTSSEIGYYAYGARASTSMFADHLGCEAFPSPVDASAYLDTSAYAIQAQTTCVAWLDCNPGSRVVECVTLESHTLSAELIDLGFDWIEAPPPVLRGLEGLKTRLSMGVQAASMAVSTAISWAWGSLGR